MSAAFKRKLTTPPIKVNSKVYMTPLGKKRYLTIDESLEGATPFPFNRFKFTPTVTGGTPCDLVSRSGKKRLVGGYSPIPESNHVFNQTTSKGDLPDLFRSNTFNTSSHLNMRTTADSFPSPFKKIKIKIDNGKN